MIIIIIDKMEQRLTPMESTMVPYPVKYITLVTGIEVFEVTLTADRVYRDLHKG